MGVEKSEKIATLQTKKKLIIKRFEGGQKQSTKFILPITNYLKIEFLKNGIFLEKFFLKELV